MGDFTPDTITHATEAVARELRKMPGQRSESPQVAENIRALAFDLAVAALDAAAAQLGEQAASAILAHMEAHSPAPAARLNAPARLRATVYRRHFQTAARVAAGAFMTEADMKRAAAKAIARGDFVACPAPEEGNQ